MFKTIYIYELASGKLTNEGYKHFLIVIMSYIRKYNWPRSIVTNDLQSRGLWSSEEGKELTHQFFEWSLTKGKFDYLSKISENYLSYYFSQIFVSFIANRIKEEQQKEGLSFDKCRELVLSICKEDYVTDTLEGNVYVFIHNFSKEDFRPYEDFANIMTYLTKIPIKESIKHFRPLVKMAIEDIFNSFEAPIQINKLTETVYLLFDQNSFKFLEKKEEIYSEQLTEKEAVKFNQIIQELLFDLKKDDAKMIFHFLFQNLKAQSLSEIAELYKIPKSTFHHKIDSFKKKIASSYSPENEMDGILFIQNISKALDEYSK